MSTESSGTTKRPLSSEGAETDPDPANLEQQQQHIESYTKPQHETRSKETAASGKRRDKAETSEAGMKRPVPSTSSQLASLDATSTRTTRGRAESEDGAESGQLPPRQVIAVSASKSPAAFFNLARKFLVSNEMCDLSALEGAIVSAVDAAHLLERSKLASIVRVQTSYVTVEPKRKKQAPQQEEQEAASVQQSSSESTREDATVTRATGSTGTVLEAEALQQTGRTTESARLPPDKKVSHHEVEPGTPMSTGSRQGKAGPQTPAIRELRRARIVITVRRTEHYKQWLEENPLQAMIASEGSEGAEDEDVDPTAVAGATSQPSYKNLKQG